MNKNNITHEIWIDIMRGIGILLVILGHTHPPFVKIIYGFHMPMFFVISGYLWKEGSLDICRKISKYLKKYIVPYFVLCFINLVLDSIVRIVNHSELNLEKYCIGILYSRGNTDWMPNCSPLWYLTCYFMSIVIFECIQLFSNSIVRYSITIVSAIISYLLDCFEMFKLPWNIDTALMGVFFLSAGNIIKKSEILKKFDNLKIFRYIFAILFLAVGVFCILINNVEMVSFNDNCYGNIFLMLFGALSTCLILFYACYTIRWNGKMAEFLSWMGNHTIFIIGFDYASGTIARGVLGKAGLLLDWSLEIILKIILLTSWCFAWNYLINRTKNDRIKKLFSF